MSAERWLRIAVLRCRSLFQSGRVERELDEELRDHVERQTAAYIEAGMTPANARTAALRALGGFEARKEEMRDAQGIGWVRNGLRDLRYGLRLLGRSPSFAVAAIGSLAVGIAANTAWFAAVDALMLKTLPVHDPGALAIV